MTKRYCRSGVGIGLIKIPQIFKGRIPGLAFVSNTEASVGLCGCAACIA
jgi:hypothetical protein